MDVQHHEDQATAAGRSEGKLHNSPMVTFKGTPGTHNSGGENVLTGNLAAGQPQIQTLCKTGKKPLLKESF